MTKETLQVSVAPRQLAWLKSRQETDGFATIGDFIRELVRREQEAEAAALAEEFRRLDSDGSGEAEPEASVLARVRGIKRERREAACHS